MNNGKFENNELKSVVEQIKLDIVKQENNYFDEVEKYLKANGVEHPDLNNLCKKLQKEKLNKKYNFDVLFLDLKKQNITPEQFAKDYCLVSVLMKSFLETYEHSAHRFVERIRVILDINSDPSTPKCSRLYKNMTKKKQEKEERQDRLAEWMKLRFASLKLRDENLSSFIKITQKDVKTTGNSNGKKDSTMYENMELSPEEDSSIEKILSEAQEVQEKLCKKDDSKVIEYIKDLSKICGKLSVSEICDALEFFRNLSIDTVRDIFAITKYATSLIKCADVKTVPEFILEIYNASENKRDVSERILQEMYNLRGKILDKTAIKEFREYYGVEIDEILSKFDAHFREKHEMKKEYRFLLREFIHVIARHQGADKHGLVDDVLKCFYGAGSPRQNLLDCLEQCAEKKMSPKQFRVYLYIGSFLVPASDYTNNGVVDIYEYSRLVFYMISSFIRSPNVDTLVNSRMSLLLFFVEKRGDILEGENFYNKLAEVFADLRTSRLDCFISKSLNKNFIESMKNLTSNVISPLNDSFFSDIVKIMSEACWKKYKDFFTDKELCDYSSLAQYVNTFGKKSKSSSDLLTLVIETMNKNDNNLEKSKEKLKALYRAEENKIEYATDLKKYI